MTVTNSDCPIVLDVHERTCSLLSPTPQRVVAVLGLLRQERPADAHSNAGVLLEPLQVGWAGAGSVRDTALELPIRVSNPMVRDSVFRRACGDPIKGRKTKVNSLPPMETHC